MRVFVTGGSGFIGYNLVRTLRAMGNLVGFTMGMYENRVESDKHPEGYQGPMTFGRNLRKINPKDIIFTDVLFHQAANNDTQDKDEARMFEANLHAPMELFHRFADAGCKRFVYASSTAVYGNSPAPYNETTTPLDPLTPYARSKVAFDEFAMNFARDRNVNVLGLRYCNVYGPGENHKSHRSSMIRQMIASVAASMRPRLFWDGSQKRDWVYIEDVVRANIAAMRYEGEPDIINIGSGRCWTFLEVMDTINKVTQQRSKIQFIPNPFPRTYQYHTECSIDRAVKLIDYEPQNDLEAGIRKYLRDWT